MGFWRIVLAALSANFEPVTRGDVKIQIRRTGEVFWRDHAYVASNPESVQNALQSTSLAFEDADVRAIDRNGLVVDYR